ncbi:ATP-binding protein [Clostridium sp. FAM 1755]|uniref:ATP-binding protein n=1 Tax=Clostridium caseinilyticum TaxID=3350403 RepID=UPI0038F805E7
MSLINIKPEFFNNDAQANFDYSTHANPGFNIIDVAVSRNNILFEGIRGTGKTHILKAIREETLEKFPECRILPVYISLAKISEYESLDENMFRVHLYTSIVQSAVNCIRENIDIIKQADSPLLLKAIKYNFPIFNMYYDTSVVDFINEIDGLLNKLNDELLSGNVNIVTENSNGVNVDTDAKILKVTGKHDTKEQLQYIIGKLSHLNASRYIVEFFKEIRKILELEYSLLLIDEISGVSNKAQTEVFRLLRLIRGSTDNGQKDNFLYFIGSVYPPQKTNYPAKAFGSEFDFIAGEDCSMEYLELNVLNDDYEEFFKYITYKRLEKIHPESNGDYLWIFEDEKTFLLTSFAANGLPRRYFEILKNAYSLASKKYSNSSTIQRIDYNSVSSAIQNIVDSQILSESQLTDEDFDYLEKKILPKLSQRNSSAETKNESRSDDKKLPVHLFLSVSRSDRKKLANLIYRGAIHNLNRTRKSRTISGNEQEVKGLMLMLDLAVAFNYRVFNIQNAINYFKDDLRNNAKRGYLYYSDITL